MSLLPHGYHRARHQPAVLGRRQLQPLKQGYFLHSDVTQHSSVIPTSFVPRSFSISTEPGNLNEESKVGIHLQIKAKQKTTMHPWILLNGLIDLSRNDVDGLNANANGDDNYQVLDPGDESEEDDLNDLDDNDSKTSGAEAIDEDDEELFDNKERHFADHFLEQIGGEDKVLAGQVLGHTLKEVSTTR
ncbi:hypothetical protein PPTG_20163 [Phytophthora nicotianae INRA-310]|uniref:Uncharacterized protein n=1 Tax=Phytophthora nicotianae (strain INRA-310) TaxID=761204 RepID=W2PBZ5_PHYN3|nr:hypothetical protein PPTG_20163 [Phytophthora nicotianae INRA-310]ETM97743.1 hypothetical protein PPTG_20163 [Phytophthora nicotianae INRA-310]